MLVMSLRMTFLQWQSSIRKIMVKGLLWINNQSSWLIAGEGRKIKPTASF